MLNRLALPLSTTTLLFGLLATAPAIQAQETFEPARMLIMSADGEEMEYAVGDASFYISSVQGYDEVPDSVDFSLSLSSITPIDANLLQWSSQKPSKSTNRARSITIIGVSDDAGEEIRYEITEANVTSVSLSQSTYGAPSVSLSLSAGGLTVNGVELN